MESENKRAQPDSTQAYKLSAVDEVEEGEPTFKRVGRNDVQGYSTV